MGKKGKFDKFLEGGVGRPIEDLLNPGAAQKREAQRQAMDELEEGQRVALTSFGFLPGMPGNNSFTTPAPAIGIMDELGVRNPGALTEFEVGDPLQLRDAGQSAFETMDPAGRDALLAAGGYYGALAQSGNDPIAAAQYAAAVANAEQVRRAQAGAAASQAEQRGMDTGAGAILSEQSANQGLASDMYSSGLNAAALAAGRRDQAAQSVADIGGRVSDIDTGRGRELDDWSRWSAERDDTAARTNWGRETGVDDLNNELWNKAAQYNAVDRPQSWFNNYQTAVNSVVGQGNKVAEQAANAPDTSFDVLSTAGDFLNLYNQGRKSLKDDDDD